MDVVKFSTPLKKIRPDICFNGTSDNRPSISLPSSSRSFCASDTNLNQPCLNYLEKAAIVTVLEKCSDELFLLAKVIPLDTGDMVDHVTDYRGLEERLKDEANIDIEKDDKPERKFQKDLFLIRTLVKQSRYELTKCGNYFSFVSNLDNIELMRRDEELFLANFAFSVDYMQKLKETINENEKSFKRDVLHLDEAITKISAELGYVEAMKQNAFNYVKKWEKSRQSQNKRIISITEKHYSEIIENSRKGIDVEAIAHNEIQRFLEEQCEEYLGLIQKWSATYDEEMDKLDMEIYELKNKRDVQFERFEALLTKYESRKMQIEEYLAYKEVKRKEEEERLRIERAATRIQAWWRGVMVRRCLGKYRKKKGRKGKGKGKGKAKGGKGKAKK